MIFEINYGRVFGGKIGDRWFWKTIKAENEEEAKRIIFEEHKASYIVSIATVSA